MWLRTQILQSNPSSTKSGNDQDSGVERPWAHLLPWATIYTKIITIYTTPIDEKDQNTSRKYCTTKDVKKEPQWDRQEGWQCGIVHTHTPCQWLTNVRIITVIEILPKEWGVWAPHQASPNSEQASALGPFGPQPCWLVIRHQP